MDDPICPENPEKPTISKELGADPKQKVHHIYIVSLDDGQYYLGITDDLANQIETHHQKGIPATAEGNPQLVWSEKWTGQDGEAHQRLHELSKLMNDNPDAVVHRLQSRLPLGGFHWG